MSHPRHPFDPPITPQIKAAEWAYVGAVMYGDSPAAAKAKAEYQRLTARRKTRAVKYKPKHR